ncbi:uncharacterized protein LOC111893416 [Lactuca sativa]|nr:uncharacterized protein LOC111893416 [Lactuca sativa]
MWRSVCNRASVKKLKSFADKSNFRDTHLFEKPRQLELHPYRNPSYGERGFRRINVLGDSGFTNLGVSFSLLHRSYKRYASSAAAEEIVSTEEEDSDEIREMVHHLNKEIKAVEMKSNCSDHEKQPRLVNGIGQGKYIALRRRQIKIETEAWENAAKEYQELLVDMCEQKLAPNLPYVKSLFLDWFEPLKNAIASEQDLCREGRNRGAYAPQFDQLPADMMTIITMHKLMGLLMTGGGQGGARVVQAALHIGEAVEHEVRIHRFMEKSKRKASLNESPDDDSEAVNNEQQLQKLRKKVTNLVKKKKLQQVRHIVKQQDQLKPWGQDAQVKVGSRLIQLLMETAYIQPPVDQCEDCPPDIRPAFVHTLKTVQTPRGSRRYGVTECDPLVRKGLEKSTTLTVLGEMFESARSMMNWLGDCAKVIVVKSNPVQWTASLGLPVVQPYHKLERHLIKTSLQVLTLQRETDKVMVKRQRRAFPPNFVHSLDGSHMMMTTVACKEAGLSFAARKNPNSTLLRSKWSPIPIPYRTILEPKGQDLDYINIVHSHLLHSDWAKLDKLLTKSNSLRVKHILLKLQSDYVISLKFFKWIELHNPSLLTLETNSIILHILTKNRKFVSAESILKKIIGSCSRDVNLHSKLFDAVLHSYQMCDSTPRVFDALFKMYAQMKQFRNATYTFCRMKEYGFLPTIESCNMYMSSLLSFNRVDIALPFYNQMRRSKITINVFTLNMVMNAYVQLGKLENAVQVFDEMQGLGMNPFVSSYNTLITAYINQGLLTTAIKLKLTMEKNGISPNAITYNTIIHGFCKEGKLHDAFKVFLQMKRVNVDPNTITYNTLITACSQSGKIEKGNQIFEEMIRTGVKPDILTYNALLLGLCNEGKTKKAAYLVKELDKKKLVPNSSTFFALIKAQCARKNPDRGFQLYKSMVKSNCRPNEDTVKMLILSFLQTDDYDGAFGVFKEMLKRPIGPDLVVLSGLCKGFSKAWKDRLVMDLLSEVDNVCFSYERYEKVKSIICNSNNEGK